MLQFHAGDLLVVFVKTLRSIFFSLLIVLMAHTQALAGVHANFPHSNDLHQLELGLRANRYFVSDPENQPLPDYRTSNLGTNLFWRGFSEKDGWQALADFEGQLGLNTSNFNYWNLNEAYVGYALNDSESLHLYFGRKLSDWSELDEQWSIGLFQPRFRWDYLEERSSGLSGVFAESTGEYATFTAFASPIFIPEQGAPQSFSNGTCKSASPWFYCPNPHVDLFNQNTEVRFSLEVPPILKLISYFGYGASLRLGKKQGFYWRNSAADKPINQLLLSYEGSLDFSTQNLPAVIHPRVLRHKLLASELGYKQEKFSTLVSAISEHPERDSTPAFWNTQEAADTLLAGGFLRGTLAGAGANATNAEIAYLYRKKGFASDRGPFAGPDPGIFEPRYAFKNAYSLFLRSPIISSWAPYFQSAVRFIVDTNNEGNILMADIATFPAKRLRFNFGIDLLGSASHRAVDFISRYQRNDRVRGGLHYSF